MKLKLFLVLALAAAGALFSAFAQEQSQGNGTAPSAGTSDPVYVIREVNFDIDGRSRPYALMLNGDFKAGERIAGKDNLDKYIAQKTQNLLNQRVLETVSIEYTLGDSEEDGALPVNLLVHVKDTWNFIILPYPKYDSNDGFSITLKMRDYNFLGTLSPLRVDLGYQNKKNSDNVINFSVESAIPFRAAGLDWTFKFNNYFAYTFHQPFYYQNVTGLSLNLPWQTTKFTVGFNQYLTINEQNGDDAKAIYGLPDRLRGPYASTELFGSWRIPFGIEIGDYGEIAYTAGVSGRVNYPFGKMDESRKPVTSFSQSIGFGRVDWIGNFQKGLSVSVNNGFSWSFDRADAPLSVTLNCELTYFHPFSKYIGFYSRLSFRRWWQWSTANGDWIPYFYAGDKLRGVLDEDIRAFAMASINLDLPIRVLRFWPSEWFNNPKLHLFDFEMQFSPFTDVGLIHGPYSKLKNPDNPFDGSTKFSLGDMMNTVGLEVIVYPGFFRSLKIRGSIGYDLQNIKANGFPPLKFGFFPKWDEIYIGVDLYY
ncbi:MAG: hypothetical protein FWC45_03060 [Treponema sp.]|nr:hypothetical protein [Treponema sp.]